MREQIAELIYNTWQDRSGFVPWAPKGNSIRQDEARRVADALIQIITREREHAARAALEAAGEACDAVENPFDEHFEAPQHYAFYSGTERAEHAIFAIFASDIVKGMK